MSPRPFDSPSDYLNAAREMAETGRPTLARLLAEEAANRTADPVEADRIRAEWLGPNHRKEQ
ncbi:hypothetical protein [Streptomyces sp. NBC_01180]|uniref:hypothetical protein n=1 Tax=Streptomyces sp. NBC_01180 TaxID=2903763 RepID=UPI0038653018|nr:hypothetical protein OG708_13455 [Streptomyces sp. NBC_01180]